LKQRYLALDLREAIFASIDSSCSNLRLKADSSSGLPALRHLQQISDTVAPYDEESAGKPLDESAFNLRLEQEVIMSRKLSTSLLSLVDTFSCSAII
jgi:hypothetical protein